MSVNESTFRGWVDQELGPTPPAPADRLEWVIRAAGTNEPPGAVSRVPRRGYLALAVTLLSTGMMTGLLVKSRVGANDRDAGNDHRIVTGAPSAPVDPVPRPAPGSASPTPSVRPTPTPTPTSPARNSPPYRTAAPPRTRPTSPNIGRVTATDTAPATEPGSNPPEADPAPSTGQHDPSPPAPTTGAGSTPTPTSPHTSSPASVPAHLPAPVSGQPPR